MSPLGHHQNLRNENSVCDRGRSTPLDSKTKIKDVGMVLKANKMAEHFKEACSMTNLLHRLSMTSTGSYNLKSDILHIFNNIWLEGKSLIILRKPCPNLIWWFGLFILTHLGLNNIPICTVNDDQNSFGTLWGVGQFNPLEKDDIPHPPRTAALENTVREDPPDPVRVKVSSPRHHSGESLSIDELFPANYQGVKKLYDY